MNRPVCFAIVLLFVAASAACPAPSGAEVGRRLFSDARFSDSEFNSFSCATCHGTTADATAPRIAKPLNDVVGRGVWWGGYSPRLIDAVDFCNVFFMRGDPIDPTSPRARALYEYLVLISSETEAAPRTLTWVENVGTVARGDPRRGEAVWDASCRTCHGDPVTGDGRINDRVSAVPGASQEFADANGFAVDLVVTEKVRHGQFFGVGGNMPPFSLESLSDEDLGALIAFLGI
jgi:thiosulfate dehydrogenase